MFSPRRSTFANSFTNSERSEASTRSDFLKVPHPALRADLSRRGEALRRRGIFLWPVLLIALAAPRALAAEDYNLSLNAGETYVIKDLDPDVTALVKFFDHAHPFTVQSSAAGRLVVLGVEKGRGIITVARDGEGVRYHIAVNAIFDAKHPLAPGTAPAALTDEDTSKAEQHVSASAATPVSPGDAAQATATESVPVTGPVPIVRDTKISAEPGDPALVPGAASTASPSANSAASPAGGDVSVSSYTSPADPGARPVGKPLAHSLPVPLPLCCGRGEVRVTAGDGKGEGSDPAVVASAGPATRAESARPSAPSASSDKTDESDSDSEKTAPPKPRALARASQRSLRPRNPRWSRQSGPIRELQGRRAMTPKVRIQRNCHRRPIRPPNMLHRLDLSPHSQ